MTIAGLSILPNDPIYVLAFWAQYKG